jgi:hypothetical protein
MSDCEHDYRAVGKSGEYSICFECGDSIRTEMLELKKLISALEADNAALKAELQRAREALLDAWVVGSYFPTPPPQQTRKEAATARYEREIAKGEE